MKRFLTVLIMLLVVLVVGITALVLLVNPNDFRSYMTNYVFQRTGYQLQFDGDLRWHVWPELSVLSGQIRLTAPGAEQPIISADNMRLDVRLLPLISHQLSVKQVVLKGAVLRLTPESEPVTSPNAPTPPQGLSAPMSDIPWKLAINYARIEDSLLIWQKKNNEQINLRDFNLLLEQDEERQTTVELSGHINRNQRDLTFNLSAMADLNNIPIRYHVAISKFNYQLNGAGLPLEGIQGEGIGEINYQTDPQLLDISLSKFSVNENQIQGRISALFNDALPEYQVDLKSPEFDLGFLQPEKSKQTKTSKSEANTVAPLPVISHSEPQPAPEDMMFLRHFKAQLKLQLDRLIYQGVAIESFILNAENQEGKVALNEMSGEIGKGKFNIVGSIVTNDNKPALITVTPKITQIKLDKLFQLANLPQTVEGDVSLNSQFYGVGTSLTDIMQRWNGQANIQVSDAKIKGLNIQQLIRQQLAQVQTGIKAADEYSPFTVLNQLNADATLHNGTFRITQLNGYSHFLRIKGDGFINLPQQQCDILLQVGILGNWLGTNSLADILKKQTIPLRVYGDWHQLNYSLNLDKLFKGEWQKKIRRGLENWLNGKDENEIKRKLEEQLKKL